MVGEKLNRRVIYAADDYQTNISRESGYAKYKLTLRSRVQFYTRLKATRIGHILRHLHEHILDD